MSKTSSVFTCPSCLKHLTVAPLESDRKQSDIQKVVEGWKLLTGVPVDDTGWDKVHYGRCAKQAQALLTLFGYEKAVECMEFIYEKYHKKGYPITSMEGIVKHSDEFREIIGAQ